MAVHMSNHLECTMLQETHRKTVFLGQMVILGKLTLNYWYFSLTQSWVLIKTINLATFSQWPCLSCLYVKHDTLTCLYFYITSFSNFFTSLWLNTPPQKRLFLERLIKIEQIIMTRQQDVSMPGFIVSRYKQAVRFWKSELQNQKKIY